MKAKTDAFNGKQVNETYILHIYRRAKNRDEELVGTIELIGREEKKVFKSTKQLLDIIRADQT